MDPNQFSLRWNNHSCNIIQVFMEQLTNESLVDVTLSCQGQFIKAHKMVLSACSPYFQDLFNVHQVQHPVIILNGVKFKDLKLVVEFMYRGETRVLESELNGVFSVAEALQIKGLCSVRKKYCKVHTQTDGVRHRNLPEESLENEDIANHSSDVTAPDRMSYLGNLSKSPEPPRKRKHTTEVDSNSPSDNSIKVSRTEDLPTETALLKTDSSRPSTPKPTLPERPTSEPSSSANSAKTPGPQSERPAKVYPAKKPVAKKSQRSSKSSSIESSKEQEEESTEVLPFVQVSLDEADHDDDIDLTTAIKVNPLFIRDIDDTETSWDDPSRLVIDLPPEETDKRNDCLSRTDEKSNPSSSAQTQKPKLKVRATSELIASSKSSAASSKSSAASSKSSAASSKSSAASSKSCVPAYKSSVVIKSSVPPTISSVTATDSSEYDAMSFYKKQQTLLSQLKEKSSNQPPRPPNAFMIFANEWRKKLALENPTESNKQISVRLGLKWKGLTPELKEMYFSASRQANEDHKKKYPGYIYSPKEARLRKALLCSLRHQMHSIPKEGAAKASGDPLKPDNNLESPTNDSAMIFIADSDVVVKEELLDEESSAQNLEEEFLKMVEGGQVEAEIEGHGAGGNSESVAQHGEGGDQDDS